MKADIKYVQKAVPDGIKLKRQLKKEQELKKVQEKTRCNPKLKTVSEAITPLDVHKFLNRQNESKLDPLEVSQKTDMMGQKQNPTTIDRPSA